MKEAANQGSLLQSTVLLFFFPNQRADHRAAGDIRVGQRSGGDAQLAVLQSPEANLLGSHHRGIGGHVDLCDELVAFDPPRAGICDHAFEGGRLVFGRLRRLAVFGGREGKETSAGRKADCAGRMFSISVVALLGLCVLGVERHQLPVADERFVGARIRSERQQRNQYDSR